MASANIENASKLFQKTKWLATIEVKLADFLENLETSIKSNEFCSDKFIWNLDNARNLAMKILLPGSIPVDLFSKQNFLANFKAAFVNNDFPKETCAFSNNKIKIVFNDYESIDTGVCTIFDVVSLDYFKLLVCIYFSVANDIKLPMCACFPEDLNQMDLFKANVKMNCLKSECAAYLVENPGIYNTLTIGDCTGTKIQNVQFKSNIYLKNSTFNLDLTQILGLRPI